jgi:hypothetical protein
MKKIAIVGKAPSSRALAPYQDDQWEIWGLSDLALNTGDCPRWDRWFELHDLESGFSRWNEPYKKWLGSEHGKPIYTQELASQIPCSVVYPRQEIKRAFGPLVRNELGEPSHYYTNSVAWMLALAIHEGASEVGLWGVDMAQHGEGLRSEYAHQRPSCEYWIGVAAGRGISVTIHSNSDLCKTAFDYAFTPAPQSMRLKHKAREGDISKKKKEVSQNITKLKFDLARLQRHATYYNNRLMAVVGVGEEYDKAREDLLERSAQCEAAIGQLREQLNGQEVQSIVLAGAEDDMTYWHQHHFG